MWEEYNETGNEIIVPNVHTYNTVTEGFAQLFHAIKVKHLQLEVIYHEGSKDALLCPNIESFSLVIKSWITNDAISSRCNIVEILRYAIDTYIIFRDPKVFFDITKLD